MKLAKGEYLYRKGDVSDSMYIVRSGKIGLFTDGSNPNTELARISVGQLIGDLAFFTGNERTADAVVLSDAELVKVPYDNIRTQFASMPSWVQTMTKTLATQVKAFSTEIKSLKDGEPGKSISRLVVARAWATMTFVPIQFGVKEGNGVSIDWSTLRTYANLGFREVSEYVLRMAEVLQSLDLCTIQSDKNGPSKLTFKDPKLLTDFLKYYIRAISKNSPELTKIENIEYDTLMVLANPKIKVIPIHRGLVEIDLKQFREFAESAGYPQVTATSVELLTAYGIEIQKISSESSVKLRFHQEEITNLAKFWQIILAIHKLNQRKPNSVAA